MWALLRQPNGDVHNKGIQLSTWLCKQQKTTTDNCGQTTTKIIPLQPIPQDQQQVRRSSADMLGWLLPMLAMQILSDMASTAPKAQQEPQFPWSLIVLQKNQQISSLNE